MKRSCSIALLAAVSVLAGCSGMKGPIAGQVEESLKTRWVAKRMGELQATGTDPREARRIAVDEFKQKYQYTQAAQKVDPIGGVTQ